MNPRQSINLSLTSDKGDSLLADLREFFAVSHSVMGVLGREEGDSRRSAFLLQVTKSGSLEVALCQASDIDGGMTVEVLDYLDTTVPANAIPCPYCDRFLRVWGQFCTRCGADFSGLSATGVGLSSAETLEHMRELAGDAYEVFGSIARRGGGGEVYFARDSSTKRLVALRLEAQEGTAVIEGHYAIGVTGTIGPVSLVPEPVTAQGDEGQQPSIVPADVIAAMRVQLKTQYDILGDLGRVNETWYVLARDLASDTLLTLQLVRSAGGAFAPELHRRFLGDDVVAVTTCPSCGAFIAPDADRCSKCDRLRSAGASTAETRRAARTRLEALTDAMGGEYEFLGVLEKTSHSTVYFCKRRSDERIVGVRSERSQSFQNDDALSLRECGIFDLVRGNNARSDGIRRQEPSPGPAPTPADDLSAVNDDVRDDLRKAIVPGVVALIVATIVLFIVMKACA